MKTKKLMVFFLAVMSVFLVATLTSATEIADISTEVDGQFVSNGDIVSVTAGSILTIRVDIDPSVNAQDVKVKVELQGTKIDVETVSTPFVVEENVKTFKILRIQVPYELKDDVSDYLRLNVKVWSGSFETTEQVTLRVMRPLYNVNVMSISSASSVEAGEVLPVDVILKNIGYANLDDIYVTLRIPALNLEGNAYFGDIYSIETCEDGCKDNDVVRGKFYLTIPYNAREGIYTLEVVVKNDDLEYSDFKKILISNEIPEKVIATNNIRKVGVGEKTAYELVLVNPTNKMKVYNVVTENSERLTTSVDNAIVVIPAGSSKVVTVIAEANREGSYDFNVRFLTGDNVAETKKLTLEVSGKSFVSTSPVVILTIVLAIILLVLLVVLIVLLGKKSNKQEDFSESYY